MRTGHLARYERPTVTTADVVKGALAGAAATWVMGQVTTWLYENESEDTRRREEQARGGQSAYTNAAAKAADAVGAQLSADQREKAGSAIHWALGAAGGAAYAAMRKQWPGVARLNGLAFGAGFFMVMDELMNPVLGLTPGPGAFPWEAHARGLGGHLAYGLVNELVLATLDRVA
jgi:hypothetical protein